MSTLIAIIMNLEFKNFRYINSLNNKALLAN